MVVRGPQILVFPYPVNIRPVIEIELRVLAAARPPVFDHPRDALEVRVLELLAVCRKEIIPAIPGPRTCFGS